MASLGIGLIVVLPLLFPGFLLAYDMVFVPHPHLSGELVGAGFSLPRAVPIASIVALLSRAVGSRAVQGLAMVAIFAGAAYGAGRLTPSLRTAPRVAAAVLYAWNPFTYERLLLGQWALLLGYAALPWVGLGALSFRRTDPKGVWRLTLALAAAAFASPYTGLVGAVTALSVAFWPPHDRAPSSRRIAAAVAVALVVNLPWLVPAVLHPAVDQRAELAMQLFRARPDSPFGVLGSLASLGGIWRPDLAPPGRSTGAWVLAFAIIAGLAVAGWRLLGRRWPSGARSGLLFVATLGLFVAAAPSLPGFRWVSAWLVHVPGGALLRDSQKFVMPLALLEAVCFGLGVERIIGRAEATGRRWGLATAWVLACLPIALAPSLAWGAGGRLYPVSYPPSWTAAERLMSGDAVAGSALALPWHSYLPFAWNDGRTVHQPAPLFFSRPVVSDTSLEVGAYRLPSEDPRSATIDRVVRGSDPLVAPLSARGFRYVILFKEADWRTFVPRLEGGDLVLDAPDLSVYRFPVTGASPAFPTAPLGLVMAADAVALALVALACARLVRSTARNARSAR